MFTKSNLFDERFEINLSNKGQNSLSWFHNGTVQ